jgi:hypothetical protein
MCKYVWISILAMSFAILASAAHTQESWETWEKIRSSDGITGYSRSNPRSPINEVKAIGLVDAPVAVLEAVVRDISAEEQWMFMCSKAYLIKPHNTTSTTDSYYSFFRQGLPWPVSDRIATVWHELTYDKSRGILMLRGRGVDLPMPARENNGLRLPLIEICCIMTPVSLEKTEVSYQILADTGGHLPKPVLQLLNGNLAVDTIKNIRKMVKKDPYRSARSIITQTPPVKESLIPTP